MQGIEQMSSVTYWTLQTFTDRECGSDPSTIQVQKHKLTLETKRYESMEEFRVQKKEQGRRIPFREKFWYDPRVRETFQPKA